MFLSLLIYVAIGAVAGWLAGNTMLRKMIPPCIAVRGMYVDFI